MLYRARRVRRLALTLFVASALAAVSLIVASSGSAQSTLDPGLVKVSMPTELGNCPKGGTVVTIRVSTANSLSVSKWGTDSVLARVVIGGGPQLVSGAASCYRSLSNSVNSVYTAPAVTVLVNPTFVGQTFAIGPPAV
jgi:hypothetical protein